MTTTFVTPRQGEMRAYLMVKEAPPEKRADLFLAIVPPSYPSVQVLVAELIMTTAIALDDVSCHGGEQFFDRIEVLLHASDPFILLRAVWRAYVPRQMSVPEYVTERFAQFLRSRQYTWGNLTTSVFKRRGAQTPQSQLQLEKDGFILIQHDEGNRGMSFREGQLIAAPYQGVGGIGVGWRRGVRIMAVNFIPLTGPEPFVPEPSHDTRTK